MDDTPATDTDLGPLPEVDPRSAICRRATTELLTFMIEWTDRYGLTACEQLDLLALQLQFQTRTYVLAERRRKKEGT